MWISSLLLGSGTLIISQKREKRNRHLLQITAKSLETLKKQREPPEKAAPVFSYSFSGMGKPLRLMHRRSQFIRQ